MKIGKMLLICLTSLFFLGSCDLIHNTNLTKVSFSDQKLVDKKQSDWLIIMYEDGDNNLNNAILTDINEAEFGLSYIRKNDGSARDGFDTVNIVVLWDGVSSGSRVYELGADSKIDTKFSALSKNRSAECSAWLSENNDVKENGNGEVNMGSKITLSYFLKWVNNHYEAEHTILIFGDHGSGPGNFYSRNLTTDTRAICIDDTSNSDILSSKDVGIGLYNGGYNVLNKLDIIYSDVCLGASIEDAYELSDYTDYYVVSANNTPGNGANYSKLCQSITENITPEEFTKELVKNFYEDYNCRNTIVYDNNVRDEFQNTEVGDRKQYIYSDVSTLASFKSSEIKELAENISIVADLLIQEGSEKYFKSKTYLNYIQNYFITTHNFYSYPQNYLYYNGSMNTLLDLGVLMDGIVRISAETIDGSENSYAWPELNEAAQNVIQALKKAIVCSWREGLYDEESRTYGMYSRLDGIKSADFTGHHYGMTICGSSRKSGYEDYKVYSWYETDLAFGADTSWFNLLKSWFTQTEY